MERMRHRNPNETAPPQTAAARAVLAAGGTVQVIWGSMTETLELAAMSVGDVFRMLQAPLNIAPAVAALVNGDPVDGEYQLQAGDELEFTRPAGEKGGQG
jgi:sulfur carrier protein ThiS